MDQEFVYGVYSSLNEAEAIVDELTGKGVSRSGIKLLANDDVVNQAQTMTQIESIDELTEKTSHWWEGLLDFFTFDSHDASGNEAERKIDFSGYKENIKAGELLVVVDGAFEDAAYHVNLGATPTPVADHTVSDTGETDTADHVSDTADVTEAEVTVDDLEGDAVIVTSNEPLSDSPDVWVDDTAADVLLENETDLPDNLHNPVTGASLADEPGVNIEEFEDLTEEEVTQLDRIPDESRATELVENDLASDSTADEVSDPTIHEEVIERNTRRFDNMRHPRENVTPLDVQQTFDEIRDPK